MLAHFCDDEDERLRYFVAPTSDRILSRLKAGDLSVRSALDQPLAWLADVNRQGEVQRAWVTSIGQVPQDALPLPDVMLRPEFDPLIRLRAIGDAIRPGTLPTSVVRQLVTGVEQAIRTLVNFVFDRGGRAGRPPDNLRDYYSLHAQQFAFNSFEIGFRIPSWEVAGRLLNEDVDEVFAQVEDMLVKGCLFHMCQHDFRVEIVGARDVGVLLVICQLLDRVANIRLQLADGNPAIAEQVGIA